MIHAGLVVYAVGLLTDAAIGGSGLLGELGVDALEHVIEVRVAKQLQQGPLESMVKVGRNQPCPCGSGKKYKQCCLTADEAAEAAAREEQRRNAPPPPARTTVPRWTPVEDDDDYAERLDQMSNGTVDLIGAGKLDEAERMCHRLLDDFPDLPDGYMRLGQLFRVRGQPKQAAQHLRLAAAAARALNDDGPSMSLSLEAEADELDPPAP